MILRRANRPTMAFNGRGYLRLCAWCIRSVPRESWVRGVLAVVVKPERCDSALREMRSVAKALTP